MPTYEYACRKCNRKFAITITVSEYEKKRVKCPKCTSTDVARRVSGFYALTSKKS